MTGPARSRTAKLTALAAGLVVVAAGCASNAPQDTLQPEAPQARTIDNLIMPIFGIAGIVFVLILGGALWVSLKFRARDDADYDEFPEQIHGNFRLEIGWTAVPAAILAVIAVFTVITIFDLAKKPADDAITVEVIGHQWWWEYRYDLNNDGIADEIITANDMVVPVGRDISLKIMSRDVIHSWWAPRLNGKKDAVPGRVHPLTIHTEKTGEYLGQCTEYCGLSHAEMRIKVISVTPEEFETWAEAQQQPWQPPESDEAVAGWELYTASCTTCHRVRGMTDPGSVEGDADPRTATEEFVFDGPINQVAGEVPDLTHFMSRTTFAGAKFDLRRDTPECRALGHTWASTEEGLQNCLNRADLEAWLRNAPAMKAMYPGESMSVMSRGMPGFDLTEDQIDQLVAFLITLK